MATKNAPKTTDIIVSGTVSVSVPLSIPSTRAALKKLRENMNLSDNATLEDIAKALILDAIRVGLDDAEHRQSCESTVEEYDLETEIE